MSPDIPLNVTAPVNLSSYGQVSLHLMKAFHQDGKQVAWWPIGSTEAHTSDHDLLGQWRKNSQLYDRHAPSLRVFHQFDLAQHVGRRRHVAFTIFELDDFTEHEWRHLDNQDALVVCSHWARDVLGQFVNPDRVVVAPLGVDHEVFRPRPLPEGDTVFLHVGKWEVRKSHAELLTAFEKAFCPTDPVRLVMHSYNHCASKAYNDQWERLYTSSPMASRITLSRDRLDTDGMASLMGRAHCGVFPSRAEGFDMGLSEMMAMGRVVVATNHSAHLEYCNRDNALLVEPSGFEKAHDGIWFHGQGSWMEFGKRQVDQLAEYLREVHRASQQGRLSVNQAGIDTMRRFTWKRCMEKTSKALW